MRVLESHGHGPQLRLEDLIDIKLPSVSADTSSGWIVYNS